MFSKCKDQLQLHLFNKVFNKNEVHHNDRLEKVKVLVETICINQFLVPTNLITTLVDFQDFQKYNFLTKLKITEPIALKCV